MRSSSSGNTLDPSGTDIRPWYTKQADRLVEWWDNYRRRIPWLARDGALEFVFGALYALIVPCLVMAVVLPIMTAMTYGAWNEIFIMRVLGGKHLPPVNFEQAAWLFLALAIFQVPTMTKLMLLKRKLDAPKETPVQHERYVTWVSLAVLSLLWLGCLYYIPWLVQLVRKIG